MTDMPIEETLFDPQTNSVENVQTFQPTLNFHWKEYDSIKPTKQKSYINIMEMINYKNQHFNLIVDEEN